MEYSNYNKEGIEKLQVNNPSQKQMNSYNSSGNYFKTRAILKGCFPKTLKSY